MKYLIFSMGCITLTYSYGTLLNWLESLSKTDHTSMDDYIVKSQG